MGRDLQQLEITTHSADTIIAINAFIQETLRYGANAEGWIEAAVDADPTCALAHAYAAAHYLSWESLEGRHNALCHLLVADRFRQECTHRELLYIDATMAWAAGDITEAIAGQEAIVERYPTDLLAVQQAQYHYFYQGKCEKLLHVTEKAFAANTDNHYLHGMLAFGHEQCQNYQAAEQFGRQAIALNRNDVWAQHAVAHVLDSQSRLAEGIAWMESHVDTWQDCNSMLYTHNWWHVALYYLKLKQFDKVLQLYDQEIWGQAHKESPKDQVGAISLLGRLELAGMTVGEQRWAELAPYAALRVHEHTLLFQDLHYLYALSRAHQTHHVQTLLESLTHHIQGLPPSQWVWRKVGLPLAKGIVVYQQHHWQTAVAYFEPVLGRLRSIGGSRTQRELFEAIYYDAFKRSLSSHSRSWRMAS